MSIVLVIEDDVNKRQQLVELVRVLAPSAQVDEASSYRSGLKAVVDRHPVLVVLDMTIPTFDVSASDKGGRARLYGGRDILEEIQRRRIMTKVVVVTQFDSFGDDHGRKTLTELDTELTQQFAPAYLGAVYYHRSQSAWRQALTEILLKVIGEKS